MKKSLLALGALAVLTLPTASSCGGGGGGSSGEDYNTSCRSAKKGTKVIKFWHAFKNVNQKAIGDLTAIFNKEHEGQICVEMSSHNDYDTIFEDINVAVQSGVALPDIATTYPDHVATYQESNIVVDMKQFAFSTDETVAMPKTGKDSWEDILESYRNESVNYRFNAADMAAKEGKMYSLPLNKSTEVMYYNKTFFDYWTGKTAKLKNGKTLSQIHDGFGDTLADQIHDTGDAAKDNEFNIGPMGGLIQMYNASGALETKTPVEFGLKNPADINPSDPTTWWTWDDVEKVGKIIQAITLQKYNVFTEGENVTFYKDVLLANPSKSDPIDITKTGNITLSYDSTSNLFVTLANQVNSYVSLNANTAAPELKFNSEEALAQYEMYERLYKEGIATVPQIIGDGTLKYATAPFTSEYLFLSVGSVAGANLNYGGTFETGTAPIPQTAGQAPKVIQQGTNITMLNKNGSALDITNPSTTSQSIVDKSKAAWEYVKYITGHDANLHFATNTTYLPTRTSVINSPEYVEYLNADSPERAALKTANLVAATGSTFTDPPFKSSGTIRSDAEIQIANGLSSTQGMRSIITAYYATCLKTLGITPEEKK